MPMSTKQLARRSIAMAHNHIEKAAEDLINVQKLFEAHHEDLADQLGCVTMCLAEALNAIDRWCDACWGWHPEDYEKWRLSGILYKQHKAGGEETESESD